MEKEKVKVSDRWGKVRRIEGYISSIERSWMNDGEMELRRKRLEGGNRRDEEKEDLRMKRGRKE